MRLAPDLPKIKEVLEYRQRQVNELEIEYNKADDKIKKMGKILPLITPMKEFWSLFRRATISNDRISIGSGEMNLPFSHDNLKNLQSMLDVLVENFTIDRDNKVSIQLTIPVLEGIHEDAERCRQLSAFS